MEDPGSTEGGGGDDLTQSIGGEYDGGGVGEVVVGGGGGGGGAKKAKSCKGCLFYTSSLKSNARNPLCLGISRTLPQVPSYVIGDSEMEASKEGRSLTDFKYACAGYSVFIENKKNSTDQKTKQAELPFCVGLEVLVDRRPSTADHVTQHAPGHAHSQEV